MTGTIVRQEIREQYAHLIEDFGSTSEMLARDMASQASAEELIEIITNPGPYISHERKLRTAAGRRAAAPVILECLYKKTGDFRQALRLAIHPEAEDFFAYRYREGGYLVQDFYGESFLSEVMTQLAQTPKVQFDHIDYVLDLLKEGNPPDNYDAMRLATTMLIDVGFEAGSDEWHLRCTLNDLVCESGESVELDHVRGCIRLLRRAVCRPTE